MEREETERTFNIFFCSILLALFFFVSGFQNIYKILTIKTYSPMTRTLFDSILDIFIYAYDYCSGKAITVTSDIFLIYLFCKIIIIFFNLVYNEFLVIYCFGMEKNTHFEIQKRILSIELPEKIINERNVNSEMRESTL